jgi:5'(3')-deoxyribonucleotidase
MYKMIKGRNFMNKKINENTTIYLDMDGVLADFFEALARFYNVDHWKEINNKEKSVLALKGTDFFYTLDPFETTFELISHVAEISADNWGICSSPLRGDRDNSAYHKRRWLESHDIMPDLDKLIFTGMKEKYATNHIDGSSNILIDDKPTNIQSWEAKGGVGILYQANENDLEEELFTKLEEVYTMQLRVI